MKRVFAILLFFLFSWPVFFKTFVLVNWISNKDYIENVLCVKKDTPGNTCKGSCHMNAQLKKTENQSTPQELPFHKLLELEFSTPILSEQKNDFPYSKYSIEKTVFTKNDKILISSYIAEIFQPPKFV